MRWVLGSRSPRDRALLARQASSVLFRCCRAQLYSNLFYKSSSRGGYLRLKICTANLPIKQALATALTIINGLKSIESGVDLKFRSYITRPESHESCERLQGEMVESIGIIGAGITGLATAYVLSSKYNVTIVARDQPGDMGLDWASPWYFHFFDLHLTRAY